MMEIIYFLIASIFVIVVPGPTVSLIIANSLKSGMRAGILNVVGTQLGLIILIVLLAVGFKAITPLLEEVIKVIRIIGAIYLILVALVPEFMVLTWHVPFYFGGTSLLIVVVVVMDFMVQLQTHLMSQKYEGLIRKRQKR